MLFGISFVSVLIINKPANVDPVQNCNLGHLEKREILFSSKKKDISRIVGVTV